MLRICRVLTIPLALGGLSLAVPSALAQLPPGLKRTDVKIEATDAKAMRLKKAPAATPSPLTLRSLSAAHAVEVTPYVEVPESETTHTLRVQSK